MAENILNIDEDSTNGLIMKSRLYFGYRVASQGSDSPLAVVIVESLNHDRFLEDELRNLFENKEGPYLAELFEQVTEHAAR